MSPIMKLVLAAALLAAIANAQPGRLTLTATNSINFLYIDNTQISVSNGGQWDATDTVDVETYARLIAIRANNVVGGCSGILASTSNMPLGYELLTNSSWKCSSSAPNGWEELGFDDSSWDQAHEVGLNGVVTGCPWIPLNDISSSAYWIWTELFDDGDMVVSCRGYTPVCDYDPCQNGGTCQPNAEDLCDCPVRWGGRFCEVSINECDSNPCQNGGTCELDDEGYICNCDVGYTGVHCETDTTDCASQPCENGGTCIFDIDGGYTCNCMPGFTGVDCEVDIDECASEPCLNGATCNDMVNGVDCDCAPGWTGILCQNDINECESNPCMNQATCNDEVNGYDCVCHPGWTGVNCETGVGECESNPCQNGGTCTLGGPGGDVACICTPGWSGPLCDSNEDECISEPCLNGGTCVDGDGEFTCHCDPIFQGATCNEVVPHCGTIMAQSSLTPARNFWALCEINISDHPDYINTPCNELITGINYYNDSQTILALGGTFGCFATKFPDELPDSACVPNYNQDGQLGTCLSCTHMGVCIDVPPPS